MIFETISHYSVLEKLGEGGMGVVFKAQDTRLERFVALKFLPDEYASDPVFRDRFLREARAASALNHPNICTIYEIGEEAGRPFLAMEFLDGVTLREVVHRGPVPFDQLLNIALDVVEGLTAAHTEGVIHRDIKLANIFITRSGRTKILDFGLAKKTAPRHMAVAAGMGSGETDRSQLTSGLAALGTAAYMSPEQALGKPLDERTDLFSFGIVLYEMATGQAPFRGDTTGMLFLSIVQAVPQEPRLLNPEVPENLQRIISRCLEKDRDLRYQHASEIRNDLRRLRQASGSHEGVATAVVDELDSTITNSRGPVPDSKGSWPSGGQAALSPPPMAKRVPKRTRRFWKAGIAAGVIGALVVAVGLYLFRARKAHALAAQSSIVIADFANTTGDQVFDGTLRQALAIDLAQSPFVNVVGDRRTTAALKQMEKPLDTRLSHEVAREVCLRTNSKAYVAGSITHASNEYELQIDAKDCETDETIAHVEGEAANRNGVINALDRMDHHLRRELGESLPSAQRFHKPLAEATTSSLDALQAYTTGVVLRQQKGSDAALPYLKQAVKIDPNFALAYSALGATYANTNEPSLSQENYKKAFELRNRVSEWERFHIEIAYYASFGDTNKTVQMCTEWISTYPADPYPRIRLAAQYADLGRYEQAAEQLREALRLAPDNYVSYVNLTEIYLGLKRPDEARATLEAAQAQHLSNESLLMARYELAFADGDAPAMQQTLESGKGQPGYRDILLQYAADTEAFYGRLKQSRIIWTQAESAALAADANERAALYYASQAWHEAELGNRALARTFATQALTMSHGRDVLESAAFALAKTGDVSRASELAGELDRQYPQYSLVQNYSLPSIRALVEIERGHPDRAIEMLKPALQYELSLGSYADLRPAYVRGLAYLRLGRGSDAASEFEKLIDNPGVVLNSIIGSLSYLQLARAETVAGDPDNARTHYQDFLALWKDADPDIPLYQQAKAEYAKLK